ncbi:MAG: hypothetical protein ABIA37_00390 [Candidatus Woesearchaeota archaeon]
MKKTKKVFKPKVACCSIQTGGCSGAIYGLGFIGAVVYYLATATGFWMGVLGVLKALVWPAFLVYGLLKFLGM